ncbi:MAG: family transcriptional regulator [Oscillospiraceae bacterium]|jgi:transcriptional regulator with XRE-family HTH domain|nr:family transcriptional regulator [Oscillospiraceae bacterium]
MNANFPRVLTLLRKEQGISQKAAANELEISQALLSHYEKGIRECGLDFVVRAADFYGVSCDYLLGRSPDRNGATISIEDIPEPEALGKENTFKGSILPTLNKKLISNSLNIMFDYLQKSNNKTLINEVSSFLMMSVYRMFRVVFSANSKNQQNFFTIPKPLANAKANAQMALSEACAYCVANGENIQGLDPIQDEGPLLITSEKLSSEYPLFSSSLVNLIQNCENRMK